MGMYMYVCMSILEVAKLISVIIFFVLNYCLICPVCMYVCMYVCVCIGINSEHGGRCFDGQAIQYIHLHSHITIAALL